MAKTDKKKQKQRRKSESEELSSDSSAESIDKKPNKRRKTERITSSSDSDDEDNKTPSKMNRNMAKTDKKKQKQRRKSESEEYMSDSSAESIDKKPKKGRKTERVSSSSDSDNEDNKTPSKRNIDRAKTDKRKQKQGRKSESEERKSGPSEESIDTKPNKRRKESVSTSSDSDDEDNRTPKKKKNTSRKTAPPSDSDSDSETPQPSQKIAAHKTPSKSPDLLQTFKNTNELNDVSTKARPLLSDLSDSDVFFVQIPKSLHPQLLTDTLVSLDEKAKLRVGKTSYVWDTSGPDRIPLNVMELRKKGKGVIKRLNCPRIIVREQFKLKQFPLELGQQPDEPVPYPADLKSRHPLFGSEYVERIKLDEGVKRKLSSAREKRVKEKRRKRDLKNESDVYEEMFLSQNELGGVTGERNQLNFEVKRKKKRKRELDQ